MQRARDVIRTAGLALLYAATLPHALFLEVREARADEVKFFAPSSSMTGELISTPALGSSLFTIDAAARTFAIADLAALGRTSKTYSSVRISMNVLVGPVQRFGPVGLATCEGSFDLIDTLGPLPISILSGIFTGGEITFVDNVGTLNTTSNLPLSLAPGLALAPLLPAGTLTAPARLTWTITKTSGTLYSGTAPTLFGSFRGDIALDAAAEFHYTCRADFDDNGFVDDADFVIFAEDYAEFTCPTPTGCRTDFNADDIIEDIDFVFFTQAYEAFVCP